jgi:hypothetical protein
MNSTKYLEKIRSNTAYPTLRWVLEGATKIGYLYAAGYAIFGLIKGLGIIFTEFSLTFFWAGIVEIFMAVLYAVAIAIVITVIEEIGQMLADVAESIIEFSSRYSSEEIKGSTESNSPQSSPLTTSPT